MQKQEDFNLAGVYTYDDLLDALKRGWKFGKVVTYRDGTQNLHTVLRADDQYIYWNHYGSSANDATPEGMQFIIERIFKMTLSEFVRAFIWA